MNKILGNRKAYTVFVLPAAVLYLVLVVVPIMMSVYYSLLDWDGVGDRTFIAFSNFAKMFGDETFLLAAKNSLILAAVSVVFQLIPAFAIAMVLCRGMRGEKFYRTAFFIPVVISTVVIGQMFLKIYNPEYGALNALIEATGIGATTDWLGNPKTVLICVFIPVMWQYIGYHMLLMYTATKSIPNEIFEAAKIDGASEVQLAFRISLPLIKNMLKVCVTFAITGSLKFFDFIWILTRGGPLHASEVPSTLMYQTIFNKNQYGYGSSMAIFIIIECLVFYFAIQKLMKTDDSTY